VSAVSDERKVRELTGFVGGRYDRPIMAADRQRERGVTCPTCRTLTAWQGNPHRPFCSVRCRLIDLGHWLDERYRVPANDSPEDDGEAPGDPTEPGLRNRSDVP
jgi:hypothetical protein